MTILNDIYKSFFGKNHKEAWLQFSHDNNGIFTTGKHGNLDSVEVVYLSHKIIFDSYVHYVTVGGQTFDTEFTRIRLEFITPDDLRFRITKHDFINTIGKFFGAQDIEVGDQEFDKKHMIKGNNEFKIQTIFSHKVIKSLIMAQEDTFLQLMDEEGAFHEPIQEGHAMLYYISETLIKDKEKLNSLLKLYQILIDQLIKTCSIKRVNTNNLNR